MDFNFEKLPYSLQVKLHEKLTNGEPFKLEVTEDKFLLEIPPKPTGQWVYKSIDLLVFLIIIGLIAYSCS